tara:strand:+ start:1472 stop:2116 length:645 start_codon:yes stop_codon:yes gene_type:complete
MATSFRFEFIRRDLFGANEEITSIPETGYQEENTATFIPTENDLGKILSVIVHSYNQAGTNTTGELDLGSIEDEFLAPSVAESSFIGEFIPGKVIEITDVVVSGGEGDITKKYQFVNQSGVELTQYQDDPRYTIKISDLGKTLAVNIKLTDVSGRETITLAILDTVETTSTLEVDPDIDSDTKADTFDDVINTNVQGVPEENRKPKWRMKFKGN